MKVNHRFVLAVASSCGAVVAAFTQQSKRKAAFVRDNSTPLLDVKFDSFYDGIGFAPLFEAPATQATAPPVVPQPPLVEAKKQVSSPEVAVEEVAAKEIPPMKQQQDEDDATHVVEATKEAFLVGETEPLASEDLLVAAEKSSTITEESAAAALLQQQPSVVPDGFKGLDAFDSMFGAPPITPVPLTLPKAATTASEHTMAQETTPTTTMMTEAPSSDMKARIQSAADFAVREMEPVAEIEQAPVMAVVEEAVAEEEPVTTMEKEEPVPVVTNEPVTMEQAVVKEEPIVAVAQEPVTVATETAGAVANEPVAVVDEPVAATTTTATTTAAAAVAREPTIISGGPINLTELGQPVQLNGEFIMPGSTAVAALPWPVVPSVAKETAAQVVDAVNGQVVDYKEVAELENEVTELEKTQAHYQQRIAEMRRRASPQSFAETPVTPSPPKAEALQEDIAAEPAVNGIAQNSQGVNANDENDNDNINGQAAAPNDLEPPEKLMVQNAASDMASAGSPTPSRPTNAPPRALLQRAIMGEVMRRNRGNSRTARPMASSSTMYNDADVSAFVMGSPLVLPYYADWEIPDKVVSENQV